MGKVGEDCEIKGWWMFLTVGGNFKLKIFLRVFKISIDIGFISVWMMSSILIIKAIQKYFVFF
jgi:hypothetical protein